jgi:hypothetical protein
VWIQISEDLSTPVEDGLLATWDTTAFNGLFAIQMIVLREDRKVDTTTIQITVDNQLPEITIPYPENGQEFQYEFGKHITLQAQPIDNIGLDTVVFYVDDYEIARQTQPPYAVPWRLTAGDHTLRVQVIDLAGNTSETSTNFTVME